MERSEDRGHQCGEPKRLLPPLDIVDIDHRFEPEQTGRDRQHRSELRQHRGVVIRHDLDHGNQRRRDGTQSSDLGPELRRLVGRREPTVSEEEPHILERAGPGKGGCIVLAVMEEASVTVHCADRGVGGDDTVEPGRNLDELLRHTPSVNRSTI